MRFSRDGTQTSKSVRQTGCQPVSSQQAKSPLGAQAGMPVFQLARTRQDGIQLFLCQQLPQDELQNPTVPVVIDFDRGIDPQSNGN
jgi:hypothetical protein